MVDAAGIARVPPQTLAGDAWRQQAPGYDPRTGEGARLHGGRFNPPNSFPVLYLCLSRACAVAELRRQGEAIAIGVDGLLPRDLYRYRIDVTEVLDLTVDKHRDLADISVEHLVGRDWTACQLVGVTAHALSFQAIRSPSATGVGDVLAVLLENLGTGAVEPTRIETWVSTADLA